MGKGTLLISSPHVPLRKAKIFTSIDARLAGRLQLGLNIKEAVVLGDPLSSTRGPRLKVTSPEAYGQVRDEIISCLT